MVSNSIDWLLLVMLFGFLAICGVFSVVLSEKSGDKQFYAHVVGKGCGCDYTVGCNELLVPLPKTLTSIVEAMQYVQEHEKDGCFRTYGEEQVESIVILEVADSRKLQADVFWKHVKQQRKQAEQGKKEATERAEYERLKAKFETGAK